MQRIHPLMVAASKARCCGLLTASALLLGAMAHAQPVPSSPAPVARFEYDAEGNLTRRIQAPNVLSLTEQLRYDGLQRLYQHLDPKLGSTDLTHLGSSDHLARVTDPRRLITRYGRDGLGAVLSVGSPDAGFAAHTVNAAGLTTGISIRGPGWQEWRQGFGYDALNRIVSASYSYSSGNEAPLGEGAPAQPLTHRYLYDQTGPFFTHGVGRLTTTQFPVGERRHRYDAQGRLVGTDLVVTAGNRTRTYTVGYGYNAAGQLQRIDFPSGRQLTLGLEAGLPQSLAISLSPGAAPTPLLSNVKWAAWSRLPSGGGEGPWLSWEWQLVGDGSSLPHVREFDEWGRLTAHSLGPYRRALSYDAADRIASLTHTLRSDGSPLASLDQSFGYDENSRLILTQRSVHTWRYGYDANGNRSTHDNPAWVGSSSYTTAAGSNRLLGVSQPAMSWSYDARGNAQTTGPQAADWQATHDPVGQLSRLSRGPAVTFYQYDAERRRVLKDSSANPGGGWTVYVYGLRGELLGEYDHSTGGAMREYAWLQDTPVALIGRTSLNAGDEAYFIHTDHLDTPRLLTDRLGRVRWSWLAEPFGNEAANHQPTAGLDAINLPLRMPGQIWDPESGLFYNHHRYYEARVGRYIQSDPIGLEGGINTYSYVGGNPVSLVDPEGLDACVVNFPDMPIEYAEGRTSTLLGGHSGVLGYSPSGSTRYYEYGRYSPNSSNVIGARRPAEYGNIRRLPVPDLKIGPDGKPTPESLKALLDALSRAAGKGTPAELSCSPEADEKKVYEYLEQLAKDRNRKPYNWKPWSKNHCRSVAADALKAGK